MTSPAHKTIPIGSAAYLASGGYVTQTLNYLPYGEDWVDIKHNLDPSLGQYTFTGKERDEETGYGYFGARYMDHELMTGWLSVDPMADKYPGISPYAYCAWNPVRLVDPDGRDFETIVDHDKKTITIRAQFYINGGTEKQRRALQQAIAEWNSCEFNVNFPGAEKGSDNVYRVCFDINNSNGEGPLNHVSFLSDKDFNASFPELKDAGGVSDGSNIIMRNSSTNNQQLAHEMGHCLGIGDQYMIKEGLMFEAITNNGNVQVARLGSLECRSLLSTCGFKFKGPAQPSRKQCINTITIGSVPIGFNDAELSLKSLTGYEKGTKKFRR